MAGKLDAAQRATMIRLRDQGATPSELCRRFKVSAGVVANILASGGGTVADGIAQRNAAIRAEHSAGADVKELASRYSLTTTTIRDILKGKKCRRRAYGEARRSPRRD